MEQQQQKRQRPVQQQPRLPCARCGSSDTKFCYYNNYNTSQPRYYCRTCKRHWTHGGTLRNVPEGGSSKKTKKKPSSSSLKIIPQPQALDHQIPSVAAGIGIPDRAPVPPPFFYGGGGERDEPGLLDFNPGAGINLGDFGGSSNPAMAVPPLPGLINPLDGISSLQQLMQQPRLSMALHQNLLMFQQQQAAGWRQQQQMNAPPAFSTAAPTATTSATIEERNRSNTMSSNMSGAPRPPPSSSFM